MGQNKYAFNFLAETVENKLKREVRAGRFRRLRCDAMVAMIHGHVCVGGLCYMVRASGDWFHPLLSVRLAEPLTPTPQHNPIQRNVTQKKTPTTGRQDGRVPASGVRVEQLVHAPALPRGRGVRPARAQRGGEGGQGGE